MVDNNSWNRTSSKCPFDHRQSSNTHDTNASLAGSSTHSNILPSYLNTTSLPNSSIFREHRKDDIIPNAQITDSSIYIPIGSHLFPLHYQHDVWLSLESLQVISL